MPFCFILFLCLFVCFRCHLLKVVALKKAGYNNKKRREEQGGFKQDIVVQYHASPEVSFQIFPATWTHPSSWVLLSQHTPTSVWASFLCGSSRTLYSVCGLQMGSQIPWNDWLFHGQIHLEDCLVVTGPLVWMDDRSLANMLLQNREESGSCSVWHNLHEPQCWWLRGVYHAEDPDFRCRSATNMVLKYNNIVIKIHIKFNFTVGLRRNRDSSTCIVLPGSPSKIVVLRSVVEYTSLNHLYT